MSIDLPLEGVKIVDFSQFLAGPYASLRLADMGAEVTKVERAGKGDLSRYLYVSNVEIDGESSIFHAINRGKDSVAVDLKTQKDRDKIWALIEDADIVLQNFRPGVIDRLGFGYDAILKRKPDIIYGSISGYGVGNDWDALPGQDLLAQARSGVMWLSGAASDGPVAIGLPVADILAGAALAQGLLALLFRRERTGKGGHIETSLIEAITDLQFELLTTFLNDGGQSPQRSAENAAHAYLAAPYGIYKTTDGYLAVAMNDLEHLATSVGLQEGFSGLDPFTHRDIIKKRLADHLVQSSNDTWLQALTKDDIWAAPVLDWQGFVDSGVLQSMDMVRSLKRGETQFQSLACPIRIDGTRPGSLKPAPLLGAQNDLLDKV